MMAKQKGHSEKKKRLPGQDASLPGEDATTKELEAVVFGRSLIPEAVNDKKGQGQQESFPNETKSRKRKRKAQERAHAIRKCAWADPDDATFDVDLAARKKLWKFRESDKEVKITGEVYEQRLRKQFTKLHGNVRWAEQPSKDSDSSDDSEDMPQVPTSAKAVADGAGGRLKPKQLEITRVKDVQIAPGAKLGPAVIQALQFHPNSELLLTAGFDKKLRFFNVDGDENPKVSSYFFEKFPIHGASFTPNGDQVLLTSSSSKMWGLDVHTGESFNVSPLAAQAHRRYYGLAIGPNPTDAPGLHASHMYTVLGDAGTVLVCDVTTRHLVRTLRMSAGGVAAVFSHNQDTLFTADQECNLYEWDLGTGRCRQKVKDSWATRISSLSLCRTAENSLAPILAVGTASGNLDLFDVSESKIPKEPNHSIGNLTTSVTGLRFHHEGELLAAFSRQKKDAMKLVHVATSTVFETWPTEQTPLHRVSAVDFSRQGGFLAIGNERGKVLLYQLSHYAKAAVL